MVSLDSTFLIDLLKRRAPVVDLAATFDREAIPTTMTPPAAVKVRVGGLRMGGAHRERVRDLLASVPMLAFDAEAVEVTARLAAQLMDRGESLSEGDLLVAGVSLRHREEVVTRNRAFARVPGLSVRFY